MGNVQREAGVSAGTAGTGGTSSGSGPTCNTGNYTVITVISNYTSVEESRNVFILSFFFKSGLCRISVSGLHVKLS